MFVVVNISPGVDMSLLMETLAARTLTFSVTDDLSKLCGRCSLGTSQPLPVPHQKPEFSPTEKEPVRTNAQSTSRGEVKRFRSPANGLIRGKKRGMEEELSESDAAGEEILKGQMDQLMQAAMASTSLFKTPKEEPTANTSMTDVNTSLVSDLFKRMEEMGDPPITEEVGTVRSTKDMFRGECKLCQMPISIRSHHQRRHALKHLGFKTYICQLCQRDFNRSDLCKSHFERYHTNMSIVPFQDTITSEQQEKLDQMILICFPDEHRKH